MMNPAGVSYPWDTPIFRKDIVANIGLSVPLGLAALGWICLASSMHLNGGLPMCIGGNGGFGSKFQSALGAQWAMLDQKVILIWAVMVVAMMMPISATHLSVAIAKSLPRYRMHVLVSAMVGYVGVWLLLGLPYFGLLLLASALENITAWPVFPALIYTVAILWCFSSSRQKALRRCHPVPAFFGDRKRHAVSAGIWGAKLAVYCAVVCFLAMSAPMVSGQGLTGMIIATHILLSERRALRPEPSIVALPLSFLFLLSILSSLLAQG